MLHITENHSHVRISVAGHQDHILAALIHTQKCLPYQQEMVSNYMREARLRYSNYNLICSPIGREKKLHLLKQFFFMHKMSVHLDIYFFTYTVVQRRILVFVLPTSFFFVKCNGNFVWVLSLACFLTQQNVSVTLGISFGPDPLGSRFGYALNLYSNPRWIRSHLKVQTESQSI